jgi:hypothetical protein
MITVVITVVVVISSAAPANLFQLLVPFVRLWTVLAIPLGGFAVFLFSLVDLLLAVIGAGGKGTSHQASDDQQGYGKHLLGMGHVISPYNEPMLRCTASETRYLLRNCS